MIHKPYIQNKSELPETIPVFPLTGVLLLPGGQLPLNIFEDRYIEMIDYALGGHRLIGIVQPKTGNQNNTNNSPELLNVGCAGKITDFSETPDGRYLITLTGISRFKTLKELETETSYRQIKPNWLSFSDDLAQKECKSLDRDKLNILLKAYFNEHDIDADWEKIQQTSDQKLITCLCMICPFEPQEKQALLEAPCCNLRADLFMTMLSMSVNTTSNSPSTQH